MYFSSTGVFFWLQHFSSYNALSSNFTSTVCVTTFLSYQSRKHKKVNWFCFATSCTTIQSRIKTCIIEDEHSKDAAAKWSFLLTPGELFRGFVPMSQSTQLWSSLFLAYTSFCYSSFLTIPQRESPCACDERPIHVHVHRIRRNVLRVPVVNRLMHEICVNEFSGTFLTRQRQRWTIKFALQSTLLHICMLPTPQTE